jgi:cell filamentation protein
MSDKYGNDRDPYLYPGLNVMRNRLSIRQADRLAVHAMKIFSFRKWSQITKWIKG